MQFADITHVGRVKLVFSGLARAVIMAMNEIEQ